MRNLISMIVIFCSISISAQTWNSYLINSGYLISTESLGYLSDGNPYVVYRNPTNGESFFYSWYNSETWNTSSSFNVGWAIHQINTIRTDSIIHIITRNNYPRHIRLIASTGQLLSSTILNNPSSFNTIVFDGIDKIHYVYVSTGLYYKYYSISNNAWSNEVLVEGISTGHPNITIDQIGRVWISYKDIAGGSLKLARSQLQASWNIWFIDTNGSVGDYSQIWVDNTNTAHIAYYDATNQKLKYATFNPD